MLDQHTAVVVENRVGASGRASYSVVSQFEISLSNVATNAG